MSGSVAVKANFRRLKSLLERSEKKRDGTVRRQERS